MVPLRFSSLLTGPGQDHKKNFGWRSNGEHESEHGRKVLIAGQTFMAHMSILMRTVTTEKTNHAMMLFVFLFSLCLSFIKYRLLFSVYSYFWCYNAM